MVSGRGGRDSCPPLTSQLRLTFLKMIILGDGLLGIDSIMPE